MAGAETPKGPEELPKIDNGSIAMEKQRWAEFQEKFIKEWGDHELTEPLLRMHKDATASLNRIDLKLKQDLPGAYEECWKEWETLAEMYKLATETRARILSDQNLASVGLHPGEDMAQTLQVQAQQLNFPAPILNQLQPILLEVGVDPLNIPTKGSRFFYMKEGTLNVDVKAMRKAQQDLAKMEEASSNPDQKKFIERIRFMLVRNENISPVDRFLADEKIRAKGQSLDWGRIGKLTGIALLAGYSLISFLQGNKKFGFATAIALLFWIKPDILSGKDKKSVTQVASLMQPKTRTFLAQHLGAPGSSNAVQEIFNRTDGTIGDTKAMNELLGLQQINGTDLDRILGPEPTDMKNLLLNTPPAERAQLLKTLSGIKLEGARSMTVSIVKNEFEPVQTQEQVTQQLQQPS